jgi:signal transduction histidine kinase/ActR/RegA family two-component response regulator
MSKPHRSSTFKTSAVLAFALLAALASIGVVTLLHARANAARDAQVKLARTETELNALQGLPWKADPREGGSPALALRRMQASEQRIERTLAALRRDFPTPALSALAVPMHANFANLERVRALVAQSQSRRAGDVIDIAARDLSAAERALHVASVDYQARASASLQQAMLGSAAVILALLAAFAFFYRRSVRARSKAETLALALGRSEAHLAQAQRLAGVGSWEWHADEDRLTWSVEQARLHNWPHAEHPTSAEAALELIDPADRPTVAAALDAAREDGDAPPPLEYRVTGADGVRVIHCQGEALRDADGRWVGLVGTSQDITERFRRAEAERANQAKNEFLSRMSHELRTPLNAVLGFGQLLARSELQDRQRANVDQILTAGTHLVSLINEVLEISRIEAREIAVSLEPVHLATVLDGAVDLVAPLAAARRVSVTTSPREIDDVWVHADQQRIKQVLLNLLSNAIKYNRENGHVEVRVESPGNDRVRVVVADTGVGIAPDMLSRLFTPFERLGAEHGDVEGTGLGLSLSRGLIEAMGGTIEVESTPGAGTVFTVELGAAEPIRLQAPVPVGSAPASTTDGPRRKVLCVEDNVSNLKLIEQIFATRPDIELLTAVQGTIGVELARQHLPELVLLDLNLPDLGGDEVLKRLHADPATEHLPVVILSADATPRQLERLLSRGAHAYLTKPIDVAELVRVVDDALLAPDFS